MYDKEGRLKALSDLLHAMLRVRLGTQRQAITEGSHSKSSLSDDDDVSTPLNPTKFLIVTGL